MSDDSIKQGPQSGTEPKPVNGPSANKGKISQNKGKISRRNMLAALGVGGVAAFTAGMLLNNGLGLNGEASSSSSISGGSVIVTTIGVLRTETAPSTADVYCITDSSREGLFIYDPHDTTSTDNGSTVLVSGTYRFKRIERSEVYAEWFGASGSSVSTTGSIHVGSNQLTVTDLKDFKAGQGVLIGGAGADTKHILGIVFEHYPASSGTFSFTLPGESAATVSITAVKEVCSLELSTGATASGQIGIRLDGNEFMVPVTVAETAADIAARIRSYYYDGWAVSGIGTTVTFTADAPGNKADFSFRSESTGVNGTASVTTQGSVMHPRDVAHAIRALTFSGWTILGTIANHRYPWSNVVYFIANANGFRDSTITINDGGTGLNARAFVSQYGSSLTATIQSISGNVLTLSANAVAAASNTMVLHNDTAAIQNAINSMPAGGTVKLGSGVYNTTQAISVKSGIRLLGAGNAATILNLIAARQNGLSVDVNVTDVYIGHLQIRNASDPDHHAGTDSERAGIVVKGGKRVTIEHCVLDLCDDAGISIGSVFQNPKVDSYDCKVMYNLVKNTAEGSAIEVIRGHNTLVLGNTIQYASQWGIRLCGTKQAICSDNHIRDAVQGIKLQSYTDANIPSMKPTRDTIVSNNSIWDVRNDGFYVSGWLENCSILNNSVANAGENGFNAESPLYMGGVQYTSLISIEGNRFRLCKRGFRIKGDHRKYKIAGNTIVEPSIGGVYLDGEYDIAGGGAVSTGMDQIIVENNTIFFSGSPASSVFGIRAVKIRDNCMIYSRYNTIVLNVDPAVLPDAYISIATSPGLSGTLATQMGGIETNTTIQHVLRP